MKTGQTERRLLKALVALTLACMAFAFIGAVDWRLAMGVFLLVWAWKLSGADKP